VGALLDEHSAQLGGFALSFAAIGRLWLAHHGLYEHVSAYDRAVVLLNLAWAATIVVLPFATQLVVQFGTDRGAVVIYMGCLAVSSCLLTATMWHMRRQPELLRDTASLDPLGAAGTSVAFILALALGAAGLGYWPLLLLTVDGRVTALLRKAPTRD
jgi:uncharacterized membrane protein